MNYENFTDKGLQLMHDAIHKAIAADSEAMKRASHRLAEPAKRRIGVITPRDWKTRWLVATCRLFRFAFSIGQGDEAREEARLSQDGAFRFMVNPGGSTRLG